ncbi:hypothetical protein F5J12DRAFT_73693 [Pisolithus orientalis]|uniref:uncharacterized protein n=1 Tax=Pisolithus orientalis TaxID=936130 RepID=UPI002224EAFB|nr:uncharacterized protein F5J12DRAFT_73693 [Pisolithus orientalis]KAI6008354.1 hypothetical protein F5J12DRAFT_73693 [Pisolithus orientalis]
MAEVKKQEKDFSPEVDTLIPEATELGKAGKLSEALEKLFALEKQTRNASDLSSTTRLAKTILDLCYEARDYTQLNATIHLLSKKHWPTQRRNTGIRRAGRRVAPGDSTTVRAIKYGWNWRKPCEQLQRARSSWKRLVRASPSCYRSTMKHLRSNRQRHPRVARNRCRPRVTCLSDLQVETYSSMERREKTEFILEQIRLLIALARLKDAEVTKTKGKEGKIGLGDGEPEWVKARVGGRKINETFLKEKENEDLKLKFYELMIQLALHRSAYLDVAKHYEKVWDTPSIKEDEGKNRAALEHIVYYVVLAPHDNEQSDMLHHLFVNPALEKLELHYNLVKSFVTRELMRWPGIEALYGPFLRVTPVFSVAKQWEDLHTRVIEHNIRVVAYYYTRITLSRLTTLLDLTPQQTEETLARLVVSKTIWARIDRPAGIVNFKSKRTTEDVMNDWSSDMQRLLGLAEKTWMGMNAALAAQSRVKA